MKKGPAWRYGTNRQFSRAVFEAKIWYGLVVNFYVEKRGLLYDLWSFVCSSTQEIKVMNQSVAKLSNARKPWCVEARVLLK